MNQIWPPVISLILATHILFPVCLASGRTLPGARRFVAVSSPAPSDPARLSVIATDQMSDGRRLALRAVVRNDGAEPVQGVRLVLRLLAAPDANARELERFFGRWTCALPQERRLWCGGTCTRFMLEKPDLLVSCWRPTLFDVETSRTRLRPAGGSSPESATASVLEEPTRLRLDFLSVRKQLQSAAARLQ
ncbi:hypothetical protein HRbin30_03160 [bacterium HR30]|nr:hypothetical protein HRbin30_03160 [bacterium HR30]